jgi:DNA (cytosine-5)-methyltransferase 1
MREVETVAGTNGFNVVSTFSGCGGVCVGLKMAGYKILWANEFIQAARETYISNSPEVILSGEDIREVSGLDILEQVNLSSGEIDLLEGSPPCASFSTAGSLDKAWGKIKSYSDSEQRADDLFFEYARIVKDLQPKVFIAENVSGLVKGKAVGYFKEILKELKAAGYEVEARLLDASFLGVPQARQRIIFVGVRNDLVKKYDVHPVFPKPNNNRVSLEQAVNCESPKAADSYLDPETKFEIGLLKYAVGKEWKKTKIGKSSDKYFSLTKPRLDRPVGTITATAGDVGAASICHPLENRKFNLQELRALQSFPADFILTGTYQQRAERIGRSVPPLMARAIGETIKTEILEKIYASR